MNSYGVIYIYTNSVDDKEYVGQTTSSDPIKYCRHHIHAAINGSLKLFHKAIRKHGPENFSVQIIWIAFDKEALDQAEDLFIMSHNTLAPNGYNLRGGGSRGKFSEITKKKLSDISLTPEGRKIKSEASLVRWAKPDAKIIAGESSRLFLARPETKAARAATEERIKEQRRQITLNQFSDPIARDRHSQITHSLFAEPDYRERHRVAHNTPECKAKMAAINERTAAQRSAILSKKRWITDGEQNRFVDPDTPMPEGWVYGRVRTPALLSSLVKARAARRGRTEKGV